MSPKLQDNATYSEIARQLCELQMARQRRVQAVAKQFGLSSQQLNLMWHLTKQDQPAMGVMAEIMGCDTSNITMIADKLGAKGLLRKVRSEDRRVKRLELTPEGLELQDRVIQQLHQPEAWLSHLSAEERDQFSHLLGRCLEAAQEM